MKKRSAVTAGDLVDPSKRGTIIIGNYRCGSHFVQDLITDKCRAENQKYVWHGEIAAGYVDDAPFDMLSNLLTELEMDQRYHVMIVNHVNLKYNLLLDVAVNDWHLVRITSRDKRRWFRSNYMQTALKIYGDRVVESLMIQTPDEVTGATSTDQAGAAFSHASVNGRPAIYYGTSDGGRYYDQNSLHYLKSWMRNRGDFTDPAFVDTDMPKDAAKSLTSTGWHHDVSMKVYDRYLELRDIHQVEIHQLHTSMINHWLTQQIPVDIELDYQDLPALATPDRQWKPNDYPEDDIVAMLHHGKMIDKFLSLWQDLPGKFKEPK